MSCTLLRSPEEKKLPGSAGVRLERFHLQIKALRIISAVKGRCLEFLIKARRSAQFDLDLFWGWNVNRLYRLLSHLLQQFKDLKFQIALNVKLGKRTVLEEGCISIRSWFVSNAQMCYIGGNKGNFFERLDRSCNFFTLFLEEGSGWRLERVLSMRLKVIRCTPVAGAGGATKVNFPLV